MKEVPLMRDAKDDTRYVCIVCVCVRVCVFVCLVTCLNRSIKYRRQGCDEAYVFMVCVCVCIHAYTLREYSVCVYIYTHTYIYSSTDDAMQKRRDMFLSCMY
jgi:hypothetical protein